MILKQKYIRS